MATYKLINTKSGNKTLVHIDKRETKLHSAYDPLRESERAVSSFNPGRSNMIIVTGLGLGYHVKKLMEKYPGSRIIILEKDPEVRKIVEKTYPENITEAFIVNSSIDLPSIFEEIDISRIRGISSYIHRPSYMLYKEYYDSLLRDIREYVSSKFSDLLTRFEFEQNWIDNIFTNIHHIFSSVPVRTLFGKFKGIPGVIVSAGPSLKKNVKELNNLKDKALIVCVDTALNVLLKNNITPHLVMTLDSQKYSLKHFFGLKNHDSALIADIVSYPRVLEAYKGKRIVSTTSKYYTDDKGNFKRETTPVWDWIENYTGPVGDIQSGGSVATSVFDLFLNFGCSSIILVGQDLAYTGREIHCTGTYHNDEWLPGLSRFNNLETINQNVIRKRKIKYVEAYSGGKAVISDFVFDIYKYWFKDSAGKVNLPVINATEGGARIGNTIEKPLSQISLETVAPQQSPEKMLKSLLNKPAENLKKPGVLLGKLEDVLKLLNEVLQKSTNFTNKKLPEDEIMNIVYNSEISGLIMPFLRKTFIYLNRHQELPPDKASDLLITDVLSCSRKIVRMLEVCKKNLENIR